MTLLPPSPVHPPLSSDITTINYSKPFVVLTEKIVQMKQCWPLLAKTTPLLPQPVNPPLSSHITTTNYSKHLAMLMEKIKWMKH